MESHLPTRPSSDLHRRLSVRKRPPAAMETQHRALPGLAGRNKPRSSSFSTLSQSLSRLMPSNRTERGGTARPLENQSALGDSPSPPKIPIDLSGIRGRVMETEAAGEEMRRTKSWSPKKIARIPDVRDSDNHTSSKLKSSSTLKRLWELHKTVKFDDGTTDFSQHPDRPRSDARELRRAEQNTLRARLTLHESPPKHSTPIATNIQGSVAALKRSQQMFEKKISQREERRSFRESEDFIGVQGVNPRTGYPDPSTGTSSSAGDVISESAQRKLEEDENRMAAASREYKAALERRENEMRRLERERGRRRREKKERAEKKRAHLRARVRKEGRWKSDGNTWSMVTESGLSPAVQSIAGTPMSEAAPPRQVVTRPIATSTETAVRLGPRTEGDYFYPTSLPLKTPTRYQGPYVESASHTPINQRSQFRDIGTTSQLPQHSQLTAKANSSHDNSQRVPKWTNQNMTEPILRKEVESAILGRRLGSSDTVIHNIEIGPSLPVELPCNRELQAAVTPPSTTPKLEVTTPGETIHTLPLMSPAAGEGAFLDMPEHPSEYERQQRNEATVTSYQSTLMNQALTRLRSLQKLKDSFPVGRIHSLEEFPPVVLKDPISARIPSDTQRHRTPFPSPDLSFTPGFPQLGLGKQVQGTITPTTTTTGFVGRPCLLSQLDGPKHASEDQVSPQRLRVTNDRIQTPDFHPKEMPNGTPSCESQMNQADIATLSAHHLPACPIPIERLILRPCQPASSNLDKLGPRSILTFTSISPQRGSASQQDEAVRNVSKAAFLEASSQRLGTEVKARSSSLVSSKPRPKAVAGYSAQGRKTFSEGNADIGDRFRTREGLEKKPGILSKRIEKAKQLAGASRNGGEYELNVWRTDTEKRVRFAKLIKISQSMPSKKPKGPGKGITKVSLLRRIYGMVMRAIGTAWWFVSPVFNPRSSLRWRWGRNELTWRDMLLIGAAGLFGGGAFLIMVLLARLLGIGLQIVKGCIKVCRVLMQL